MTIFLLIVAAEIIRGFISYTRTGSVYPTLYLSETHQAYLDKYFEFYQKLPQKSQKAFRRRVARFISSKKFVPRDIPEVSGEMKVLISASAIQLTLGFPNVNLSYFRSILVYPDTYYSVINRTYHKGEVNPRFKVIVISWKYFVEGYLDPSDGRNLGLHEMAHALRLENHIMNEEYNFLDPLVLKEWETRAERTMIEIRDGKEDFFREYGATDREEFFAVAVENFFERPAEFTQKHPLTYKTLSKLLRQDPLLLEKT